MSGELLGGELFISLVRAAWWGGGNMSKVAFCRQNSLQDDVRVGIVKC